MLLNFLYPLTCWVFTDSMGTQTEMLMLKRQNLTDLYQASLQLELQLTLSGSLDACLMDILEKFLSVLT